MQLSPNLQSSITRISGLPKKESHFAKAALECGYNELGHPSNNGLYLGFCLEDKQGEITIGGFDFGLRRVVDSSLSALVDDEDFQERLDEIEEDSELQREIQELADTLQRARDRLIKVLPPSTVASSKDGKDEAR